MRKNILLYLTSLISLLVFNSVSAAQPIHNSLPDAPNVLYLDFDGETLTGSEFNTLNNANSLLFPSANYSDAQIKEAWEVTAEDYTPFNINVTTERSVYDNTPENNRAIVIITSQIDSRIPGNSTNFQFNGAVALTNSWANGKSVALVASQKGAFRAAFYAGNTISHESGHIFGLKHKGRNTTQYVGPISSDYALIMGNVAIGTPPKFIQWSKGEYSGATGQTKDEIATILAHANISLRDDAFGNTFNTAAQIGVNGARQIFGIEAITSENDSDFIYYYAGEGNHVYTLTVSSTISNLLPQITLYNSQGEEIKKNNPALTTLGNDLYRLEAFGQPEGYYYIKVEGIGKGDPTQSGFSNYGSLGKYQFEGTLGSTPTNSNPGPRPTVQEAPVADTFPLKIEAENFTAQSGTQNENTSDEQGGVLNVGFIDNNDYLEYTVNAPSAGIYSFVARAASQAGGGLFKVTVDDPTAAGVNVTTSNRGWQKFDDTQAVSIQLKKGVNKVRLTSISNRNWNINWIVISSGAATTPTPVTGIPFGNKIGIQPVIASWISTTEKFDYISARFNETGVIKTTKIPNANALRAIGEWESFVVEDGGNGNVRIKVKNFGTGYRYLVASGTAVTATGTTATAPEAQFVWTTVGAASAKRFGLKSVATDKYLQVAQNQNGTITLTLSGAQRLDWELFQYTDTGVSAKSLNADVEVNFTKVYPNPLKGSSTLNIDLDSSNDVSVELVSISGQSVFTKDYTRTNAVIINVSELNVTRGVYILKIVSGNKAQVLRVVL